MQYQHSCGVIPYFKTKKKYYFLCIKHKKGHRGFPKGIQEKGESDIQTAYREFREETGITNCNIQKSARFTEHFFISQQNIQKTVTFFLGKLGKNWKSEIDLQNQETVDYCIGTFGEIEERLTFPEAKQTAKSVYTYLRHKQKTRLTRYLSISSFAFLIFLREIFMLPSLGYFVNKLFTCTQAPYNSAPCYIDYDISIVIGAFSLFTLFLGLRFIERKRLAK